MDSYLQELNRHYDSNPADQDAAARLIAALRRIAGGGVVERYHLRNLPCSIRPDDQLWCVSGGFTDENGSGGGILEWCYDEADAQARMKLMMLDPRYTMLSADKYTSHYKPGLSLAEIQSQHQQWLGTPA